MILGCCVIVVDGICLLMADSARPHEGRQTFHQPTAGPCQVRQETWRSRTFAKLCICFSLGRLGRHLDDILKILSSHSSFCC